MKKDSYGFSLIEIMVVLVLVAILAAVAVPQYSKLVMKTKQSEAKTMLEAVYSAQQVFKLETGRFADSIDDLYITVPEAALYEYSMVSSNNGTRFIAEASANLDEDEALDVWTVNEEKTLTNTVSDIIE